MQSVQVIILNEQLRVRPKKGEKLKFGILAYSFGLLFVTDQSLQIFNIHNFYQYSPSPMQHKSTSPLPLTHTLRIQHSLLSSPTPLEFRELLPLKVAFTHWIKTLPMQQRFVAAKIHAPGLAEAVRSVFWQRDPTYKDRNCQNQTLRMNACKQIVTSEAKKTVSKVQKHLFQSLVFLSDGHDFLDHLCFDYSLLECPERLFDMLATNVKHEQVQLLNEALNSRKTAENMKKILKEVKIKEEVIQQLLTFLRQSLLLNFRNSLIEPTRISTLLEEEKQRKKDFSIFWRNVSMQHRQNLLLLECKDIKELKRNLQKEGIGLSQAELQREMQELLLLQKNQFCNRIFKCKLKKSLHPLLDYYRLVYLAWKKDVEKGRRKKQGKYRRDYSSQQKTEPKETKTFKKKEKNRKSTSVESNQTNYTEHERIFGENSWSNHSLQKVQSHRKPTDTVDQSQQESESGKREEGRGCLGKRSEIKEGQLKVSQFCQYEDSNNPTQPNKMIKREKQECFDCQKPQQKEQSTHLQLTQGQSVHKQSATKQTIVQASLQKLDLQLQEMVDQISEEANYYHERRVVAYQRIQFLLGYYHIPIKLFGSCANGIAIKNSDIDIAIDQHILENIKLISGIQNVQIALQNIESLLSNYPTFQDIKVIKTAAIPVMKVTIDTSVPFLYPQYGQAFLVLNRAHNYGPIHADITIQTSNSTQNESSHLGIRTTHTISSWLASIKSLRSIVIYLKSLLTISKLNLAYEGGLNTFAMIVMIVAYIEHNQLQKEENTASVLRSMLHFYVEEFNEKEKAIDLTNKDGRGVYIPKGSGPNVMKADLQIMDPICPHKNMTRNCYLYPEIKKLFKGILGGCFQQAEAKTAELGLEEGDLDKLSTMNKVVFAERNLFRQAQLGLVAQL